MRKVVTYFLFMLALVGVGGTAFGQLNFGTDFTTSDEVWSVTHVKVKSNMIPYYLEGIKQTWLTGNEVAKEMGQLEDYAVYSSILPDSGDYNLTLIIKFKDLAQYDKGRTEYEKYEEAWLKRISEDKREEIVKGYPEMREIVGEYLIRKIDFK